MNNQLYDIFLKDTGSMVRRAVDMTGSTTLRVPFIADLFCEVHTSEELVKVVQSALHHQVPLVVLGGGSNIAPLHQRYAGLIIKNRVQSFEILGETNTTVDIQIGSGYVINRLVSETIGRGWQGLEYQMGLPGTLGGALCMNSKWMRPPSAVSDVLVRAQLIGIDGSVREVDQAYFEFGYDHSILQKTHEICISAVLRLQKSNVEILRQRAQDVLDYRKITQPNGWTSGCFFRNIAEEERIKHNLPTTSAGYLIDKAGMKGKQIGSCMVSEKHANFIINNGSGAPEDLNALIHLVRQAVMKEFDVQMTEEVVRI